MITERNPSDAFPRLGPLRLEGAGSLEAGRDSATGMRVCIRRVPTSALALAAIESARNLPKHSGLCAALDSGTWQGEAWLVTEFPEGQLLGDTAVIPQVELAARFTPLAEALAALHLHGMPLGLLSGDAVLVTSEGKWMLHEAARVEVDRATDRRPEQTALAHLHRTSAYFSPQRLKGGAPSAADDVYALGVLLGLCAGGERPPRGSALEQVHAVMSGAWKPSVPAGLPAPLAQLITRMTAADSAQRPTAAEVVKLLNAPAPEVVALAAQRPSTQPDASTQRAPTQLDFPTRPVEPFSVPAPAPTAPGTPVFDFAPPAPAPTVPTPRRAPVTPLPQRVQLGGAALAPAPMPATSFTVSIAANDRKLIAAGLLALGMLASTVALGAHVVTARQEAAELASAKLVRPAERKEPHYSADQLKTILRQKEEARHEY